MLTTYIYHDFIHYFIYFVLYTVKQIKNNPLILSTTVLNRNIIMHSIAYAYFYTHTHE